MTQSEFIDHSIRKVKQFIHETEQLLNQSEEALSYRPNEDKWNISEIYAHLNLYSDFYLKEFSKAASNPIVRSKELPLKKGMLGGYFASSMKLDESGTVKNPMKTFKSKETLGKSSGKADLTVFLDQHHELLEILEKTRTVDLNRMKIKITLPLIRIRLGDGIDFYISHEERHMQQIQACKSALA